VKIMSIQDAKKFAGALKIVKTCANLQPHEKVLVLTDTETLRVGELIAMAALQISPDTVLAVISTRAGHGSEPPTHIATAMSKSEVVIMPLKFSMTHAAASREARKVGARMLSMGDYNERMLEKGGIEADFLKLEKVVNRVAEVFAAGKTAEISTPGGTELRMDISGRQGYSEPGFAHKPGSIAGPPNIEANVGPLEGTAEGVIVIDGSIPHPSLGVISSPIHLTVHGGNITDIKGGAQAEVMRRLLADMDDSSMYNIAELGIGLNPCSHISGSMMEDEGAYGTCHVGIGDNSNFGGVVKAKSHIDLIMHRPTIVIDGETIQYDGKLTTIDMVER
jgi:2,5-dihydroxypyridine 5,6-dioxygenase